MRPLKEAAVSAGGRSFYAEFEGQAIETHARMTDVSGGGARGHLDLGQLDSVLQNIQNNEYYPTFADKMTPLFFCTCKFHCFQDGGANTWRVQPCTCTCALHRRP